MGSCQYGSILGNVLNAKPVHYAVPAKMMINYCFVTIAIEGTICTALVPKLQNHQKETGVVTCALNYFIRRRIKSQHYRCVFVFRKPTSNIKRCILSMSLFLPFSYVINSI